jgi:glycosidase
MRLIILLLISVTSLFSQVVSWNPLFPTDEDSIEIVFNARKGNRQLVGVNAVYMHTGVITNLSEHAGYWRYVKAPWQTNLPELRMNPAGNDRWSIRFHIRSFYNVPPSETILKLAMVFRTADGSKVGKTADNQDIFITVYKSGMNISRLLPASNPFFTEKDQPVTIKVAATGADTLFLYQGDDPVAKTAGDTLTFLYTADAYGVVTFTATAVDSGGQQKSVPIDIVAKPPNDIAPLPADVSDGINRLDDHNVILVLHAPFKQFVYVIGDFNQWNVKDDYLMKQTPAGERYWLQISGLDPEIEYGFQYLVNGTLKVADPYAEKVLDPLYDKDISQSLYPNLKPYPQEQTSQIVSVLQTGQNAYSWQIEEFDPPTVENLCIYELLLRDFLEDHNWKTLTDTLSYLKNLGINAIELMPFNEFEGNSSWGYNPSFYFAPDKYYGPAEDLKRFIDAAHLNGIAVIQDIVLNHAYGQCSLVRLYGNDMQRNPWFNATSPNPVYSWGYDFNHQSLHTQKFVDRVLNFWLSEYKVDGFRLDFTKGFTNTPGDGGAYDPSRIAILKRIGDKVWSSDSTAILILEHFAPNEEEKELADHGFLLWGNMNHAGTQASMGYKDGADFSGACHINRGWTNPHLVAYVESHDEERMMYKNLQWGNASGDYNIKKKETALDRLELTAVFFLPIPGPKMIWQFGELGYDYSINYNGRVGEKPIRWDYAKDVQRRQVYDVFAAMLKLKTNHAAFLEGNYKVNVSGLTKTIHISHPSTNFVLLGNFDVEPRFIIANFQSTGMWYDYFSGDSIKADVTQTALSLQPGQYRVLSDKRLKAPYMTAVERAETGPFSDFELFANFPNPFNHRTTIVFEMPKAGDVTIDIINIHGQHVRTLNAGALPAGRRMLAWNGQTDNGTLVAGGLYFLRLYSETRTLTRKMLFVP